MFFTEGCSTVANLFVDMAICGLRYGMSSSEDDEDEVDRGGELCGVVCGEKVGIGGSKSVAFGSVGASSISEACDSMLRMSSSVSRSSRKIS